MNGLTRIVNRLGGALDNRSVEVLIHEDLEKHFAGNKRTVLYVGAIYDYGNRDWGLSKIILIILNNIDNNCFIK